jgi:hypothetical protein
MYGVDRKRAKAVAGMVQGAVVGATGTWLARHGTRAQLEDDLVTMITSLLGSTEPRDRPRSANR